MSNSPFPGMDPYLEEYWKDIHHAMITYIRDSLQGNLPNELKARLEERATVEVFDEPVRSIYPDVKIVERLETKRPREQESGGVAVLIEADVEVAEPLLIEAVEPETEPTTEGFIEIVDRTAGHRVITVIEILSPTNKIAGPGRWAYLKKQEELRQSEVSLVEIDLLRVGERVWPFPIERVPAKGRTLYQVCVRRAWYPKRYELYPLALRSRLPKLPIPLRRTDLDVYVDLQSILDQAYRNGRYDDLDYARQLDPPLALEDAQWLETLLRERKKS